MILTHWPNRALPSNRARRNTGASWTLPLSGIMHGYSYIPTHSADPQHEPQSKELQVYAIGNGPIYRRDLARAPPEIGSGLWSTSTHFTGDESDLPRKQNVLRARTLLQEGNTGRQYEAGVHGRKDTTHARSEDRQACPWQYSSSAAGFSIQGRGTTD